jgi:hypothetical protein
MKVSIGLFVLLAQSCSGFHAPPAFGVATSSCPSSGRNHDMVLPSSTALPATMLAQSVDLAEASSSKLREAPLDKYRNIGIMAHIDAGKCSYCIRLDYSFHSFNIDDIYLYVYVYIYVCIILYLLINNR